MNGTKSAFKNYAIMFGIALIANFVAGVLVMKWVSSNQQRNGGQPLQKSAIKPPRQVTTTSMEDEGTNT